MESVGLMRSKYSKRFKSKSIVNLLLMMQIVNSGMIISFNFIINLI